MSKNIKLNKITLYFHIDLMYNNTIFLVNEGNEMQKLLMFNLSSSEESAARRGALLAKAKPIKVDASLYECTLMDIANGTAQGKYEGEAPDKKMLVMCGFSSSQMSILMMFMHKNKARMDYNAVLTDTNKDWSPLQMLEEMEKEKQAIEEQKNKQ